MRTVPSLTISGVEFGAGTYTGTFEFGAAASGEGLVEDGIRTGTLVEGVGRSALDLLSRLTDEIDADSQSIRVSGGGQRQIELTRVIPGDSTKENGEPYQWGSSSNPSDGPNKHTATSADPRTQEAVLIAYIERASGDSFAPATFEWGEWSQSGIFDPIKVAIESPRVRARNDSSSTIPVDLTAIKVASLDQPLSVVDVPE